MRVCRPMPWKIAWDMRERGGAWGILVGVAQIVPDYLVAVLVVLELGLALADQVVLCVVDVLGALAVA